MSVTLPGQAPMGNVARLGGAFESAAQHLRSPDTGAKDAFLRAAFELVLLLDKEAAHLTRTDPTVFPKLSFFAAIALLAENARGDALASERLAVWTRDVFGTIASTEGEAALGHLATFVPFFEASEPAIFRALLGVIRRRKLEALRRRARQMQRTRDASPIPERAWALRNVAGTLALGSHGPSPRAREMYEEALRLKQAYLGSDVHPGLLEDLLPLLKSEGSGTVLWEQAGNIVEGVAGCLEDEGYAGLAAEVALGALVDMTKCLDASHPQVKRQERRCRGRLDALSGKERAVAMEAGERGGVLAELAAAFRCEIASRPESTQASDVRPAVLKAKECLDL